VRVLRLRRRLRIPIGHADDSTMLRAMRVQANFAEYVPLALLLMVFVEAKGGPAWFVHALCAALLLGRVVHAVGVSRPDERFTWRVVGMTLTLLPIGFAAGSLLMAALRR
jgi:uncharacterized membrane protein YecN with MAPEG domain